MRRIILLLFTFLLFSSSLATSQCIVYFKKPSGWGSNINIFVFNTNGGSGTLAAWPGSSMARSGDYYGFVIPSPVSSASLIFNDGSNQTSDITGFTCSNANFFDGSANASNPPQSNINTPSSIGLPGLETPSAMWIYKGTSSYCSPVDDGVDPYKSNPYQLGNGARTHSAGPEQVPGPGTGCGNNDTSFGLNLLCPDVSNTAIRKDDGSGWLKSDVVQGCSSIQKQLFGDCGANCLSGNANPEALAYSDYTSNCNGTKNPNSNFPSTTSQTREVKLKEWTNTKPVSGTSSTSPCGTQAFKSKSSTVNLLDDGVGDGTGVGGDEARVLILGGNSGERSSFNISANMKEFVSIDGGFGINQEQIVEHNVTNSNYTTNDAGNGSAYSAAEWISENGKGFTGSKMTADVRENGATLTVSFKSDATINVNRNFGNADIRASFGPGMGGKANLKTTFDVWEISCNATFPVKFSSLLAKPIQSGNQILWATTDFSIVKSFEVERAVDAKAFESIGNLPGGNVETYSFVDAKAPLGVSYYRLKVTEKDGIISYSKILPVFRKSTRFVTLYPNPTVDYIAVRSDEVIDEIVIYNTQKKIVFKKMGSSESINVQRFTPGIYFAQIKLKNKTPETHSFVKY